MENSNYIISILIIVLIVGMMIFNQNAEKSGQAFVPIEADCSINEEGIPYCPTGGGVGYGDVPQRRTFYMGLVAISS